MENISAIKNPEVAKVFEGYPKHVRPKMMQLRQLILDTADGMGQVDNLQEALKWNEPSYKTKDGSTIRIDWKAKKSDQVVMFFTCTTTLVETFRKLYNGALKFEGNRGIVFPLSEELMVLEVKHCISLALTYHHVKHLPMLGV